MKRPQQLPVVLSREEVARLLKVTNNLKHKALLMVAYSAGLRVGEVVRLKVNDIDSKRMQIRVTAGKGAKDRYTLLSETALTALREYFRVYKPKVATHLLEDGVDIHYIQELLGHGNIRTTERYTHVSQQAMGRIRSPLDTFDVSSERA